MAKSLMRPFSIAGAAAAVLVSGWLATPTTALACTADVGLMERPEHAFDVAFTGSVVQNIVTPDYVGDTWTVFHVDRVLSGAIDAGYDVRLRVDGCHELDFEPGQHVVVTLDPGERGTNSIEVGGYTTWAWAISPASSARPLYWWEDDDRPPYPPIPPLSERDVLAFIRRGIAKNLPETSTDPVQPPNGGMLILVGVALAAVGFAKRRRASS